MAERAGKIRQVLCGELERSCRDFDREESLGDEEATAILMHLSLLRGWWGAAVQAVSHPGGGNQDTPKRNVPGEQTSHAEDHLLQKLDTVNEDGVGHAA